MGSLGLIQTTVPYDQCFCRPKRLSARATRKGEALLGFCQLGHHQVRILEWGVIGATFEVQGLDSTGLGPVMAMQMLHFKEHDGVLSNHEPVGKLSTMPWWAQSYNGDSSSHLSSPEVANGNNVSGGGHLGDTKQGRRATTRFPLFSADAEGSKSSGDAQKSLVATSPQSECTRFNLGFGLCQITICGDQLYGLFSSSGPQVPGRMMLPLNLTTDEGLIYVNAKQYHGILSATSLVPNLRGRTKLLGVGRCMPSSFGTWDRLVLNQCPERSFQSCDSLFQLPYMHVSRQLHVMRRPRGSGGRFLNTYNLNNVEEAAGMKKMASEQSLSPPLHVDLKFCNPTAEHQTHRRKPMEELELLLA